MNRPFRQSPSATAFLFAALFSANDGATQAPEVRAHLEVVSAAGCGGDGAITSRVARRSSRIRFVEPGPGVRRARAELRPAGNESFSATLTLWSEDGRELVRRVRPARCSDALDALSLVLLVSLDPAADLSDAPATPQPEGTASQEATAATAGTSSARAEPMPAPRSAKEPRRGVPDVGARELESDSEPDARGSEARYRPFAGAFGSARGGPAPGWMPGFGAFAGVIGPGFPSEFAARLSLTRHRRSGFTVEAGSAEFELDAVRLELCPIGLRLVPFGLRACLDGELGELEASGSGLPEARSAARPWRSLGVSGWFGLRPWPVLELSASAGLEHPLVRDRFQFNPEVFHEVGPIGAWLSLGAGLSIP